MAGRLAHGDRVAGDQADQAPAGPVRCLGIEGQRLVEVHLHEPHQSDAALGTSAEVRAALEAAGVEPTRRAETLSVEEFAAVERALAR